MFAAALFAEWDALSGAILYTLGSTLGGMTIALALALLFAGLFTLSPLLNRALLPIIVIIRTAPDPGDSGPC